MVPRSEDKSSKIPLSLWGPQISVLFILEFCSNVNKFVHLKAKFVNGPSLTCEAPEKAEDKSIRLSDLFVM